MRNNSGNAQESELDEAIEPYVPLDGFVDIEDGQGSFAFLPSAQRSSLPLPPASRPQNLSAPSNAASSSWVHSPKGSSIPSPGRKPGPMGDLEKKQLGIRLEKEGISPKFVHFSDLEKVTDWRSFFSDFKVLDGETKKRRKFIVLDVESEDEMVERVAVAEGAAGSATADLSVDQSAVENVGVSMPLVIRRFPL